MEYCRAGGVTGCSAAVQLWAGSAFLWTRCNTYLQFISQYCISDYVALNCGIIDEWKIGVNLKGSSSSSQYSFLNAVRKITNGRYLVSKIQIFLPNYKSQVLPFEPMCSDPKYLYYKPIYYIYEFILNSTMPSP